MDGRYHTPPFTRYDSPWFNTTVVVPTPLPFGSMVTVVLFWAAITNIPTYLKRLFVKSCPTGLM